MTCIVTINDGLSGKFSTHTFTMEEKAIDFLKMEWKRVNDKLVADGYGSCMDGWCGRSEAKIFCNGKTIDFTLTKTDATMKTRYIVEDWETEEIIGLFDTEKERDIWIEDYCDSDSDNVWIRSTGRKISAYEERVKSI